MEKKSSDGEHDFPRSIGNPAQRALLAAGYQRLLDLTSATEQDLLQLHLDQKRWAYCDRPLLSRV